MPSEAKTVRKVKETVDEMKDNMDSILEKEDEIDAAKDAASEAKSEVQKISERNSELVDEIKDLQESMDPMQEQLDELDVKIQDRQDGVDGGPSFGKIVADGLVENVESKNFVGNRPASGASFKTEVEKSIKDIVNTGASAGDVIDPDYRGDIIPSPVLRTPRIIDLISVIQTSSDSVEWVRQDSETNNASPQAGQGAPLSKSEMSFTLNTETVETIGHIAKASVQILNDAPRLRDFINTRIRALLELELEDQVLLGDGTGNNLDGLIPNSTDYYTNLENQVVDGSTTDLDRIGVMLLQIQRQNYPPTGIVLSPLNWWGITLQKDSNDNYQFAEAQSQTSPRLWGFPVVSSNAMPEGEALVGNFELGATYFDRRSTTVEASTENVDDFEKLMVTLRAYVRGLLAVQNPKAMVHNDNMDASSPAGS